METQKTSVKHTPGPWTIEDPMEGEWWIVQANLPAYEWRTIASIPQGDLEEGFPQEVVEANARLLAAAPELLVALQRAEIELNTYLGELSATALPMVRAAIAKAEGR
jgi:hypothetical protein